MLKDEFAPNPFFVDGSMQCDQGGTIVGNASAWSLVARFAGCDATAGEVEEFVLAETHYKRHVFKPSTRRCGFGSGGVDRDTCTGNQAVPGLLTPCLR